MAVRKHDGPLRIEYRIPWLPEMLREVLFPDDIVHPLCQEWMSVSAVAPEEFKNSRNDIGEEGNV